MTFIFALFFMLLGFIAGMFATCRGTLELLRDAAKKRDGRFLDKYRVTLINGEDQQE